MVRNIGKQSGESVESALKKKKKKAAVGRICRKEVLSLEWKMMMGRRVRGMKEWIGGAGVCRYGGTERCREKLCFKACSQHVNWTDLQQVDPVTRRVHWSRAPVSRLDWLQ